MVKFVLISGKAQNGKDTLAGMLKKEMEGRGENVLILHYADLLKFICKTYFGWNGEKDEAGRTLLQRVGTDVIRKQCPDYWVNEVTRLMKFFQEEFDYVIIPDTRFPNEIDAVRDAGFYATHVRVERLGFENSLTEEQRNHISEIALDGVKPDYLIYNTTLDELENSAKTLAVNLIIDGGAEEERDPLPLADGA